MKNSFSELVRCALRIGAAGAIFAGCSGGGSPTIPPANFESISSPAVTPRISPDSNATGLLYVANSNGNAVDVYTWPKLKKHGTLTGLGNTDTLCSDMDGNVYVPAFQQGAIYEYAHGGTKPMRTIADSGEEPSACSVDPTTGDLAIVDYDSNIEVIPAGSGSPIVYGIDGATFYQLVAYDDQGNLFADAYGNGQAIVAELPKGATSFEVLNVNQTIGFPGGIMWDGKYLAVGDQDSNTIYQFRISGTSATKVGTTPLDETSDVCQFWVTGTKKGHQGTEIAAADAGDNTVDMFSYPAGGNPTAQIKGFETPEGLTVSFGSKGE